MRYIILALVIIGGAFLANYFIFDKNQSQDFTQDPIVTAQAGPKDREEVVNIESGMVFSMIGEEAGLGTQLTMDIVAVSEEVYDLSRVRAGREIKFYFDHDTDEFIKMIYPIDSEEELYITLDDQGNLVAKRQEINYEVKIKTVEGTIDSSLYESAIEQDIDIRAIIELANIFAWTVDFGMGIRQGDTYKFIYEERHRDGEYVMPGQVLAAKFVNDGRVVEGYYFSEGEDQEGNLTDGYYHPDGQSVQKMFLKNPVDFKYISSGYTAGPRYIAAFSAYTSSHMAIDYAAALGTPIRSVGDGTVSSAGWNSQGYGNLVKIRHNGTYSTNYAHMSKIYVSAGQHVSQGDVIGTVGSTGYSTGPHLHYEMVQNGYKINPLTIELPSSEGVSEEKLEEFKQAISSWQAQLNN